MIKKIISLVLILVFGGAGLGAGLMLKPGHEEQADAHAEVGPCGDDPNANAENADHNTQQTEPPKSPEDEIYEYVKLSNQFIVPIIRGELVKAIAVVALSLEVKVGTKDMVFAIEPKLRDSLLQALFDHASLGGFDGAFATTENTNRMRALLKKNAVSVLGDIVNDVLVSDIARQDN